MGFQPVFEYPAISIGAPIEPAKYFLPAYRTLLEARATFKTKVFGERKYKDHAI